MNVDVENISSFLKTFWRPIYEVIENSYFLATKLFPTKQLDQCRNNPNEPHNIAYLKKMATEEEFYSQVVMILRKESGD